MKKNLCILVLALLSVVLVNAQQPQRVNLVADPAQSDFVPSVQGAEIRFERTTHDFGEILQNSNLNVNFTFTNIGSEPLVLFGVRESCAACITVEYWTREPIMPGQEGVIAIHYSSNLLGPRSSTITVLSNGRSDRVVLRINGNTIAPAE